MKQSWRLIVALLVVFGLTACGEGEAVAPEEYTPHLYAFDVIDSFNNDTAKPGFDNLEIDPYQGDGLFEVFWQVNSLEDYSVNIWLNDRPSINSGILIDSDVCGSRHWCDQGGNMICQYTSDFYLSCSNANSATDINMLFTQVPQTLYLFLEVCDRNSSFCEYDYYPVIFR